MKYFKFSLKGKDWLKKKKMQYWSESYFAIIKEGRNNICLPFEITEAECIIQSGGADYGEDLVTIANNDSFYTMCDIPDISYKKFIISDEASHVLKFNCNNFLSAIKIFAKEHGIDY